MLLVYKGELMYPIAICADVYFICYILCAIYVAYKGGWSCLHIYTFIHTIIAGMLNAIETETRCLINGIDNVSMLYLAVLRT